MEFYLPDGTWTSFWDDADTISGPKWVKQTHDFTTLPMYVREGTVLVLGLEGEKRSDYDWMDEKSRTVKHYGDVKDVVFELRDARGETSEAISA